MVYSGLRSPSVITQPFPTGDGRSKTLSQAFFKYSTDKLPFSNAMLMRQGLAAIFQMKNFSWKKAHTSNHLYRFIVIQKTNKLDGCFHINMLM